MKLRRLKQKRRASGAFESEFAVEILKSDKLRVTILICFLWRRGADDPLAFDFRFRRLSAHLSRQLQKLSHDRFIGARAGTRLLYGGVAGDRPAHQGAT
jgi:hypothetical protein